MNKYEIHPIEGDVPYVTMHGDFSMDDLLVILDEMRELYDLMVPQGIWAVKAAQREAVEGVAAGQLIEEIEGGEK